MRPRVMIVSGLLCTSVVGGAGAQSLTIDDFKTGPHRVTLQGLEREGDVQRGSMAGGFRHTHFLIAQNRFGRPATLQIRRGRLFKESGVRVFDRLEVTYGVDARGDAAPLNLDVSGYDRFRLSFGASDLTQNINIVVFTSAGRAQHGFNRPPSAEPFDLDFPFADFVGTADFADVDHVAVVIQDGNATGSSDLVVTGFSALRP